MYPVGLPISFRRILWTFSSERYCHCCSLRPHQERSQISFWRWPTFIFKQCSWRIIIFCFSSMENGGVCDIKILRCLRKFEIFWYFYENWRDSEDFLINKCYFERSLYMYEFWKWWPWSQQFLLAFLTLLMKNSIEIEKKKWK